MEGKKLKKREKSHGTSVVRSQRSQTILSLDAYFRKAKVSIDSFQIYW